MAGTTHHHQEPESERRSFRLTMVLMLVLILIAGAALALVLVLRDDDGDSGSGTSNTTTASQPLPTTPEGFAQALYAAWKAGDRDAAARVASPEAVDQIFQFAYQPIQTNAGPQDPYQFRDCEPAAGSLYCTWAGQDNAQIIEQVRTETGGLPILVTGVQRQGG